MLYSKDLIIKFSDLESHPFSFQVVSTSESFGLSKNLSCKIDSFLRNL